MSNKTTRKPIILCCGSNGRAVIYGKVDSDPTPGQPVTLYDARMVLRWDGQCGGLLGLAAGGPKADTRITCAVGQVVETVWQEMIEVNTEAAVALDGWAAFRG